MALSLRSPLDRPELGLAAVAVLALLAFPFYMNVYYQFVVVSAAFLGIFAATYDFFSGLTGYFSFAHMVLVGLGGYTSTILAQAHGLPLFAAIVLATVITTVVGLVVIGIPSLRLSGLYFVIITVVIASLATKLVVLFSDWTGGSDGYLLVPDLLSEIEPLVPIELTEELLTYYLAVGLLVAVTGLLVLFAKSRFGIVLLSMRQDETLLESIGIDPVKYRLVGFGITCLVTGFAAAVWTHTLTSLNPGSHVAFARMIDIIIAMVLGGAGTIVGPVVGVFGLEAFDELLVFVDGETGLLAGIDLELGVIQELVSMGLVLVFIYRVPDGAYPLVKRKLYAVKEDGPSTLWEPSVDRARSLFSTLADRLSR